MVETAAYEVHQPTRSYSLLNRISTSLLNCQRSLKPFGIQAASPRCLRARASIFRKTGSLTELRNRSTFSVSAAVFIRLSSTATDKSGRPNSLRRRFRLAISARRVAVTVSALVIEIGKAALGAGGRACPATTLVSIGPTTREVVRAATAVSKFRRSISWGNSGSFGRTPS